MSVADSTQIHPTAIVSAEATFGVGVKVGPYVVVEGEVTLGDGCKLAPHVHLVGPLVVGKNNFVGTGTVIGTDPQHLGYAGQPTRTVIGDGNTFREHVTVHRGSHVDGTTQIGNNNYFMSHSHIAHDCRIGNNCIMANGALAAGHCVLNDRVFMSGNTSLHQFVRMGRLSLLTGQEGTSQDVIPFALVQSRYHVSGINAIGMKRAGYAPADIRAVKNAFQLLYRSGLLVRDSIAQIEAELGTHPLVAELLEFIRTSKRGIIKPTTNKRRSDVGEDPE